jgi:hypothetical protein
MRGVFHHEDWSWSNAPRLGSSPSGNTTSTTTNTPWSGEEPYLRSIYSQASDLNNAPPPAYYPGNTYAGLTGQQQGLMSGLINYGTQGGSTGLQAANDFATTSLSPGYTAGTQPAFDQGQGVLSNEMTSGFLNPNTNPGYQTAMSSALASAIPAATASFTKGNRSDSGLAQAASTSAAANAAGGLAQQQYNTNLGIQNAAVAQAGNNLLTQQGNQTRTALTAPMIDQATTSDLGNALNTAGMGQQNQQNQLNADVARFNYNQMLPWNQLGLYEGAVTGTGNPGGTSTTQQPYFSNTGANIMSGLSGIGSLAMMASMIPW